MPGHQATGQARSWRGPELPACLPYSLSKHEPEPTTAVTWTEMCPAKRSRQSTQPQPFVDELGGIGNFAQPKSSTGSISWCGSLTSMRGKDPASQLSPITSGEGHSSSEPGSHSKASQLMESSFCTLRAHAALEATGPEHGGLSPFGKCLTSGHCREGEV